MAAATCSGVNIAELRSPRCASGGGRTADAFGGAGDEDRWHGRLLDADRLTHRGGA
jgi:hypothetical protein